jgi:transcriptional regulator with XRE-family HTH domain
VHAAEMKTRREALGLSTQWLADQLGVQERAVRRWEAGDRAIPDDVNAVLDHAETTAQTCTTQALAEHDTNTVGARVVLTTYPSDAALWAARPDLAPLPASWHRTAVTAQARHQLLTRGTTVTITYDGADASAPQRPHRGAAGAATGSPLEAALAADVSRSLPPTPPGAFVDVAWPTGTDADHPFLR